MNKSIIVSGILFFGSMIAGCSNEHLESKNDLMDSYVSLINSNISDLDISNIKEDLKEYDFMGDSYYTLSTENNATTSNVKVYSFKDDSAQIDLEIISENQLNLNYLSNNNNSLLKSIRVNKDINLKNDMIEIYFDSMEDRNEFINELKNMNIISDSYGLYTEIEKFISNNQNISFDDIQSMFNIEFKLSNTIKGINEYTYGDKDNIKLIFDENSMKFIAIEYNYNGNKLYYTKFNNPNSQEIQEEVVMRLNKSSIDVNNILNTANF